MLGATIGLTAGLTACSSPPAATPIPLEPDELAVGRAVTAAKALRGDALSLAGSRPELADLLRRVAAVHEAHLVALGSPINTAPTSPSNSGSASSSGSASASGYASTSASGSSSTSGSPSAPSSPSSPASTASPSPAPTASALIKAETAASRIALRDGLAAAPAFAVLLCRIAAAQVANADLVATAASRPTPGALRPAKADPVATATPSGAVSSSSAGSSSSSRTGTADPNPTRTDSFETDSPDPGTLTGPRTPTEVALDRLLAGEHAAVFVYPLVIARATGKRRGLAAELWQTHRNDRDAFATRLLTAGVRPAAAEPAYDVGTPPSSSAKAATLAARVETGLAALATDLLATAEGSDLRLGADQLVLAARRTAAWTGRPNAFPGQVTRSTPAATSPAATTAPSPTSTSSPTTSSPTAGPPTAGLPTGLPTAGFPTAAPTTTPPILASPTYTLPIAAATG